LSEARVMQVEAGHAAGALADAVGDGVAEGALGAGTGMTCFDFKGGIGTSSRVTAGATVGVLVLTNFGSRRELRIDGVPVGRLLGDAPPGARRRPAGSCIVVVATEAPLRAEQLQRVARRAGLGLARTGSVAHHGSGEIFIAFSTGRDARAPADGELDPLFAATVDATEEAVLNALWSAERVVGREG